MAWRSWWNASAGSTDFQVRPSQRLRAWWAGLTGLWLVALAVAPAEVLISTCLGWAVTRCFRGRLHWLPERLSPHVLSLEPRTAVVVTSARGEIRSWNLRGWLRHPWLVILQLQSGRRHALVLLPTDSMDASDHRRLRYRLGVSIVGTGGSTVSG